MNPGEVSSCAASAVRLRVRGGVRHQTQTQFTCSGGDMQTPHREPAEVQTCEVTELTTAPPHRPQNKPQLHQHL